MARRAIKDGIYIAVLADGTVAAGVISSNPYPKVYTTEKAAIERAGLGGKVLHVTETAVTVVWPVPQTFFLNERHEIH